jgi:hypothetical protein
LRKAFMRKQPIKNSSQKVMWLNKEIRLVLVGSCVSYLGDVGTSHKMEKLNYICGTVEITLRIKQTWGPRWRSIKLWQQGVAVWHDTGVIWHLGTRTVAGCRDELLENSDWNNKTR